MINYALSKMIYIFSSNTSFKAYYCNPSNPTVTAQMVCTSNSAMVFSSDLNGFILNAPASSI
jgi:hypothetical protein